MMVFVIVHLGTVAVIWAWFARETRFSMLGNIWHAVAQLQTNEVNEILSWSSLADDSTVNGQITGRKAYAGQAVRKRFLLQGPRNGSVRLTRLD